MTFADIQTMVAGRLNLTSADALTRIGTEINDRYKRITSSIGLVVTRRQTFQTNASIGVNTMTFSGCEKLINVIDRSTSPYRVLKEITVDEMENREPAQNDFVTYYAIQTMGASSVTIRIDCVPQTAFTLYADGYGNASTLSGSQVPAFAESFHDILVHGVLADEYRKLMQKSLAVDQENQYNERLGELRLFIAESMYLDRYQGKAGSPLTATGVPGAGGGGSSFNGSQSWTQTGLVTFDRTGAAIGSRYPFAVAAGSEHVANLIVDDVSVLFVDVTTGNVTSTKHGYAPKAPADATQFLNGAATPAFAAVKDSDLSTSDVTTNNVTTAKHGFITKAPADLAQFFRGDATWAVAFAQVCQGRLTLTSGNPVVDASAATTLYFTPYGGNRIAVYNGTYWKLYTFAELSIAVPATTSQMYDVFVFDNAGTLTLELLAWTNDTTRATALTTQDGVYVKTGATTRRYVGSFRTTTVAGQTEDSVSKRFVWNYYNRQRRTMRVLESTDTWTYTTATYRQANAAAANQLAVVCGVAENPIDVSVLAEASNTNTGATLVVAIGEDSTSAKAASCIIAFQVTTAANQNCGLSARLITNPAVGYHFYAWLEFSTAVGTSTWLGDNGAAILQSGIIAVWDC